MKSMMKKLFLLGAAFMAFGQVSEVKAAVVSSQTAAMGAGAPFLIRANESLRYVVESTGTMVASVVYATTVTFQYSSNMQNWFNEVTTAPTGGSFRVTADLPIKLSDTFYRYFISGSSGGAPIITMSDIDDVKTVWKNNKQIDMLTIADDSLRLAGSLYSDKYQLQQSSNNFNVALQSSTQIGWNYILTNGRQNPAPGGTILVDKMFSVLKSSGGSSVTGANGIVLNATPTISTETATNGDILTFTSNVSSITFQDSSLLPNSGLRLGATQRALGINDVLSLIFYNGFWRELYFTNNFE